MLKFKRSKTHTAEGVAALLAARKYLTNTIISLREVACAYAELGIGLNEILQIECKLRDMREKCRNAMPTEHIEGVEEAKKRWS